jgi:hypothetical protein
MWHVSLAGTSAVTAKLLQLGQLKDDLSAGSQSPIKQDRFANYGQSAILPDFISISARFQLDFSSILARF